VSILVKRALLVSLLILGVVLNPVFAADPSLANSSVVWPQQLGEGKSLAWFDHGGAPGNLLDVFTAQKLAAVSTLPTQS
jgi:hypothetical protein